MNIMEKVCTNIIHLGKPIRKPSDPSFGTDREFKPHDPFIRVCSPCLHFLTSIKVKTSHPSLLAQDIFRHVLELPLLNSKSSLY